MTTPLSDPNNVQFIVVEDEGFTDTEITRLLNGEPLDAVIAAAFHLPGKHDQDDHGHGGGSTNESGSLNKISAMHDAYDSGYAVDGVLSGGNSGVKVELLTLSDDSKVVRKSGKPLKNHGVRREYLGGRVYSAIAGDDVVTTQIDDDTIITTYVPGDTGGKLANKAYSFREDQETKISKYNNEVQRQVELPGSKEVGMLDWLIDNPDRHDQNWIVNEDGVRPIDQGNANFVPTSYPDNKGVMREMVPASPFAAYWMGLRTTQFNEVRSIKPKFTKAELATTRAQIEELKSEFNQPGEAAWFDGMLGRLSQLEAKVKK